MGPGTGRHGRHGLSGRSRDPGGGGRRLFRWIVLLYLAVLPVGLFWVVPVAGATATGTDVLLGGTVVAGAVVLVWRTLLSVAGAPVGDAGGPRPAAKTLRVGLGFLLAFGLWTALSTLWSFHQDYALAKGLGYMALAGGAACVAWSGLSWRTALDAWLAGTALTVALTLLILVAGPEAWRLRVAYQGGSVSGLPLPRLRGPFLHPNGFGDYLLLSGVFLWIRWPAWSSSDAPLWMRAGVGVLLGTLLLFLVLSVSSAWLAAGVLILYAGRTVAMRARRGEAPGAASIRALGLRGLGLVVTGVTLAGLAVSLRLDLGPFAVTTGGVRPHIWASAVRAILESPIVGVGAAPYLAEAADPLGSGGIQLWDAHDVYLSVLGQFGLVGFGLLGAGVWLLARRSGPRAPSPSDAPADAVGRRRALFGVRAALLAMAIHGLVIAGEDFRHWWAVLGLVALVVGSRSEGGAGSPAPARDPAEGPGSVDGAGGA